MKKSMSKRVSCIVSLVMATSIGLFSFMSTTTTAFAASTTSDSTIKVAAPNALAVMSEMLGGNVVSSAQATLDNNPSTMTMPYFLPTFGVSGNNTNADPWMTHYNPANSYSGSDKTNYGWDGYAGSQLKPISDATATDLPTSADALINKPDMVIQFPVGNDTTSANTDGYYGVNQAGFNNANSEMENTQSITYYSTNNLPAPTDIKTTITTIANDFKALETSSGKTVRYGDPQTIATNFNSYYDANRAKATALTSSLAKKNIIHVTAYNATTDLYTVIPTSANDIYGSTYISDAGGNNVATGTSMTAAQISTALGGNGVITAINTSLYTQLTNDFDVSIPHYVVPTGVYLWSVRSPEGALCSQWLAKILHGSETVTYNGTTGTVGSFINVHDLTSGFYSSYYHYNTSATGTNSLTNVVNGILPSNTGSTSTSW
jgi:hypothetical protein